MKTLIVEGYAAAKKAIQESSGKIFVLFGGSVEQETGKSWCPDCSTADPVINKIIKTIEGDDITFITCHVGEKAYWKDPNNDFRQDPQLKLKCVPTLLKVGTPQRLEEEQCAKEDLVAMLFEED